MVRSAAELKSPFEANQYPASCLAADMSSSANATGTLKGNLL